MILIKQGIFVSEEDLKRVFHTNEELHRYSRERLASGIVELNFMGAGVYEYVATRDSMFHPYLLAEGKRDVYLI